jgi:hypothetical protein
MWLSGFELSAARTVPEPLTLLSAVPALPCLAAETVRLPALVHKTEG